MARPLLLYSFDTWTVDMGIFIQNQGTLGDPGRGSLSIFGDYATAVVASSDDGTKYLTLTSEPPKLACFFLGNFTIQSNWSMCFSFKQGCNR